MNYYFITGLQTARSALYRPCDLGYSFLENYILHILNDRILTLYLGHWNSNSIKSPYTKPTPRCWMRHIHRRRTSDSTVLSPKWINEGSSGIRILCHGACFGSCYLFLHSAVPHPRYFYWRSFPRLPPLFSSRRV